MELSLNRNKCYTYTDYLTWMDNKARKLIKGFIKMLSPLTAKKDMTEKFSLYEKSVVKGCWIDHPEDQVINVYPLQKDGKYNCGILYEWEGKVPVPVFNNY